MKPSVIHFYKRYPFVPVFSVVCLMAFSSFGCADQAPNDVLECSIDEDCANNGNGRTKCSDDGICVKRVSENTDALCHDTRDNDGDGNTDCADEECEAFCQSPENTDALCHDTVDNDGDGKTDCADPECKNFCLEPENTDALCHDTLDNDGDGKTDCADEECRAFCLEPENTDAKCHDGIDNDGNELTDCEDSACASFCVVTCPDENQTYLPAYDVCAHNIANKNDLIALRDKWNQSGGDDYVIQAGKPVAFVLTKNIGLGAQGGWKGIGNEDHPFDAIFVGNERVVSGSLTCSEEICGLFGVLDGAKIHKLHVEDLTLTASGATSAGLIAGTSKGAEFKDIVMSNDSLTTSNPKNVGGLIGYVLADGDKTFTAIHIDMSNMTYAISNASHAGGLIGQLIGNFDIQEATLSGEFSVSSNIAGGFVGYSKCGNDCSIEDVTVNLQMSSDRANDVILGGFWGDMAEDSGELHIDKANVQTAINVDVASSLPDVSYATFISGVIGNKCENTHFNQCGFHNSMNVSIMGPEAEKNQACNIDYYGSAFAFRLNKSTINESTLSTGGNVNIYASIKPYERKYVNEGYYEACENPTYYSYHGICDMHSNIYKFAQLIDDSKILNMKYNDLGMKFTTQGDDLTGWYYKTTCTERCRDDCPETKTKRSEISTMFIGQSNSSNFSNLDIVTQLSDDESESVFVLSSFINILSHKDNKLDMIGSSSSDTLFDTFLSNQDVADLLASINSISSVTGKNVIQYTSESEAVTKLNAKLANEAENGGNLESGQYAPWYVNEETGKAELQLSAERSKWYTVE